MVSSHRDADARHAQKENGKGRNEGTGRARAPAGTALSTHLTHGAHRPRTHGAPGPLGTRPEPRPGFPSWILHASLLRGGPAGPQPPPENPARLPRRHRAQGGCRSHSLKPNSLWRPSQPFAAWFGLGEPPAAPSTEEEPEFCPCCPAGGGHHHRDATGPRWCWGPEGSGRMARRGWWPGGGDHGVARARWHTQGPTDAAPRPSPTQGAGRRRKAAAGGSAPFLRILPPKLAGGGGSTGPPSAKPAGEGGSRAGSGLLGVLDGRGWHTGCAGDVLELRRVGPRHAARGRRSLPRTAGREGGTISDRNNLPSSFASY